MHSSFDALEFAAYLRQRWRFLIAVCAIAAGVSLAISLLLPKRYTATASLLIEAPGGNDARITTAVSPVYLESLRSYEHFAASDTLFRKALDRFQLRVADSSSFEAMKRRVLKVSKLRDTRILEIAVTLPDPKLAQAVAQFLAEETLQLNQELVQAGGRELENVAITEQETAKRELEKLRTSWADMNAREPFEPLQTEGKALAELRAKVREELLETEVEIAGDVERQTQLPAWKASVAAARARAAVLQKQGERLDSEVEQKTAALARLVTKRQLLEMQMKAAQTAFDAAEARLREIRSPSATRGERLRIVEPGIVPERPAFPNVPLNVLIAFASGALLALLYLTVAFQNRSYVPRHSLHAAAKHSNG